MRQLIPSASLLILMIMLSVMLLFRKLIAFGAHIVLIGLPVTGRPAQVSVIICPRKSPQFPFGSRPLCFDIVPLRLDIRHPGIHCH